MLEVYLSDTATSDGLWLSFPLGGARKDRRP